MTIMTNVQKLKLNEIAIPGQEGGFESDIYAIVDIDNHKIFRALPERKEFFSNQRVVADFEQSADNLNYDIEDIEEQTLFDDSQMVRIYESNDLGHGYQLRHFLWNAYNKANGHLLYSVLTHRQDIGGVIRPVFYPIPHLTKVVLTDFTQIQIQATLEHILIAAAKEIHHLEWMKQQPVRRNYDIIFNSYLALLARSPRQNVGWRLGRTRDITLHQAVNIVNNHVLGNIYMLNSTASPREISRQKRLNKWTEIDIPSILTEGYTYEETTPHTNEQDTPGDRDNNSPDPDVGNNATLSGDVPAVVPADAPPF